MGRARALLGRQSLVYAHEAGGETHLAIPGPLVMVVEGGTRPHRDGLVGYGRRREAVLPSRCCGSCGIVTKMLEHPTSRHVHTWSSPPRVLLLINQPMDDASWYDTVLEAIQKNYSHWAGHTFGILDCPNGILDPLHAHTAILFDPDLVFWHDSPPTQRYHPQHEFTGWRPFSDSWRVSELAFNDDPFEDSFIGRTEHFPANDHTRVLQPAPGSASAHAPLYIQRVELAETPQGCQWTRMRSSERTRTCLARASTIADRPLIVPQCDANRAESMRLAAYYGAVPIEGPWSAFQFPAYGTAQPPPNACTPWHAAAVGLITHCRPHRTPIVVCGGKAADFCVFYTLRRCMGNVTWISSEEEAHPSLAEFSRRSTSEVLVLLGSRSVEIGNALSKIAPDLKFRHGNPSLLSRLRRDDIYVQGTREQHFVNFTNQTSDFSVQAKRPTFPDDEENRGCAWISVSEFHNYSPPRNDAVAELTWAKLSNSHYGLSTGDICNVRMTGQHERSLILSRVTDSSTPVSWVVLSDLEILGALFRPYTITPSAATVQHFRALELVGGIRSLGRLFADKFESAIIEVILQRHRKRKGVLGRHSAVRGQNVLSRRDLDTLASKMCVPEAYRDRAIIRLVESHVLERGFCLRCLHCSSADWYSETSVSPFFSCYRCGRQNPLAPRTFCIRKGASEPLFMYALAEDVRALRASNGHVASLALANIYHQQLSVRGSRFAQTEISVLKKHDSKPWMEVDFAATLDGRLILGEGKTTSNSHGDADVCREQIERYATLSRKIDAWAMVFATDSDSGWAKNEERCMRIFRESNSSTKVMFWGPSELHNFSSPVEYSESELFQEG